MDKTKNTRPRLELTLLENSKDFLLSAVELSDSEFPRDWKYALLNISNAVELLLKAVLEKEHWSLLFEDVNKAKRASLQSGDFRSVEFGTAIARLKNIIGPIIRERDEYFLLKLRDLRNRVTHYAVVVDVRQLKSVIGIAINLFIKLYSHLVGEEASSFVEKIAVSSSPLEAFVKERMRSIGKQLEKSTRPVRPFSSCPTCMQDALVVNDSTAKCLFCTSEIDIDELAMNSEGPGGPCPECEYGRLGFVLHNNEDGEFVCVLCGFQTDRDYNDTCDNCGEVFWNPSEMPLCEDCIEYALRD